MLGPLARFSDAVRKRKKSNKAKTCQSPSLNRRSILSSIATGVGGSVVASATFSSSVAAGSEINTETKEQLKSVAEEYSSSEAVRKAIENHAQDLLEELSNRELLPSSTVDDLPTKSLLPVDEFPKASEGAAVVGLKSADTATAHIMIKKDLGTQELVIIVEPHIERSFATVSGKGLDGTETEFVRTDVNSTTSCTCYTDEECIISCSASICSCRNYDVECCPDCCECNVGSNVGGGCSNCSYNCTEATNCSCT